MFRVENLSFGFHSVPLFSGVSFDLHQGELGLMVGPNGAGKSTLMSLLVGLRDPRSGNITLDGDEVGSLTYRLNVEYLAAESNGLFYKLDAINNLKFWQRLRGNKLSRDEALSALKPWNLAHPLVAEGFAVEKFSTGMKRRLALARVTASRTKLWCLDEPFFGLDQSALDAFISSLKIHLSEGGAALVISHELSPFRDIPHKLVEIATYKRGGNR